MTSGLLSANSSARPSVHQGSTFSISHSSCVCACAVERGRERERTGADGGDDDGDRLKGGQGCDVSNYRSR